MLTTIDQKNIPFEVAQAGQTIDFDPAVDIEVSESCEAHILMN